MSIVFLIIFMETLSWPTKFLLLDFKMIFLMSDIWAKGIVNVLFTLGQMFLRMSIGDTGIFGMLSLMVFIESMQWLLAISQICCMLLYILLLCIMFLGVLIPLVLFISCNVFHLSVLLSSLLLMYFVLFVDISLLIVALLFLQFVQSVLSPVCLALYVICVSVVVSSRSDPMQTQKTAY